MAVCPKCGAEVPAESRFCPSCGQAVDAAPENPAPSQPEQAPVRQQPTQAPEQPQAYYQPPQQPQPPQYTAPVYTPPPLPPDAEENRFLCVFAYLEFLVILPAVLKPHSEFVRYHVNQGMALLLFELMCAAVCIIPFLGWIAGGLGLLFSLVCLIIGIVHACNGEMRPIPLIGKWRILR